MTVIDDPGGCAEVKERRICKGFRSIDEVDRGQKRGRLRGTGAIEKAGFSEKFVCAENRAKNRRNGRFGRFWSESDARLTFLMSGVTNVK